MRMEVDCLADVVTSDAGFSITELLFVLSMFYYCCGARDPFSRVRLRARAFEVDCSVSLFKW